LTKTIIIEDFFYFIYIILFLLIYNFSAPRLIQAIAEDRVIRGFEFLEVGVGPSKIPLRAIIIVGIIALIFILIGDLKTISPIITISFLLVYAITNYANFSLSKAYNINKRKEALQSKKNLANQHI
jgi:amino acid transporter